MSCASQAYAHKMKIFATMDGDTISGYAYLSGGGRLQDTGVNVFNPADMSPITNMTTDSNGGFSFRTASTGDHLLRVDLGDGHMAEWLVEGVVPLQAAETTYAARTPATDEKEDTRLLRHQIQLLREQLEAYEEKVRLHDILGGIGYILGLAGIASYFMGRERNRS